MRKFIFIFFSLLLSLNTFAVDFQIVGETSTTKRIAISPNDKNHENLQWLADYFHEQNKKENQAYVLIYDNIKAAQMYDRLNDLSDSESEFYDNHFIGTFWKGTGDTSRYDFTFMLDGLNGKTESIKYDRKDDVEKTEEIADEKEIVETRTSSSNTNEIDPFTKTIYILVWVFLIGDIFLLINWKRWKGKKWFDFAVVFFMGTIGVHKFREKKIGWGILYIFTCGLYFIGWLVDCIKYFIYACTGNSPEQKAIAENTKINELLNINNSLPVVTNSTIVLHGNEVCHFYDKASLCTSKEVYAGRVRSGRSTKFLGVRYSTGSSHAVYETVKERSDGYLAITNKRIIFFAPKGSFDKSIESMTAFSLCDHDTGLAFQFGNSSFAISVKNAKYANAILTRIINSGKTI